MTRVSTFGNYQSALLSLMSAQNRATQAQERISTEKIATDMAGYGRGAESLTSLNSTQARLQSFISTAETVEGRMVQQDLAMMRLSEGGMEGSNSIANALAVGNLDTLMMEMGLEYQVIHGALNAQHQGNYLFAGASGHVAPSTAATLEELGLVTNPADTVVNDQLKQRSRISENTTVETGFLASDLGNELIAVFHAIQKYNKGETVTLKDELGADVPFTPGAANTLTGKPTTDVETFLKAAMRQMTKANEQLTNQIAKHGLIQNQVASALDSHESQRISLEKLMYDKTGYDAAQAITDLQTAQMTIEASAQVINSLRGTSLLDILR